MGRPRVPEELRRTAQILPTVADPDLDMGHIAAPSARGTAATLRRGVERRLEDDELIVTKTDLKGRITYANRVFLRISALTEAQALGRPHSLIRHPDMPRAVFRLLWERLEAGQEVFAHIKNLATDGAHYWVLAHVTPSRDVRGRVVGYHSNRRRPSWSAIAEVERVHAELRRAEAGLPARRAADEGRAALDRVLVERGLSYDAWLWSLEAAS